MYRRETNHRSAPRWYYGGAKVEIFEFTPIQYPADAKESGVITTHFDYNFIHDNLVKLDILGHDDPTMIRMLEDLTGVDSRQISLDDEKTMAIFSGTEVLGIEPEDIRSQVGTFGIPEFGTRFVRQMLVDTSPIPLVSLYASVDYLMGRMYGSTMHRP